MRHTGLDRWACKQARFWDYVWDARRAFRETFPNLRFEQVIPEQTLRQFAATGSVLQLMMWVRNQNGGH